jgi:hypothetical protein
MVVEHAPLRRMTMVPLNVPIQGIPRERARPQHRTDFAFYALDVIIQTSRMIL